LSVGLESISRARGRVTSTEFGLVTIAIRVTALLGGGSKRVRRTRSRVTSTILGLVAIAIRVTADVSAVEELISRAVRRVSIAELILVTLAITTTTESARSLLGVHTFAIAAITSIFTRARRVANDSLAEVHIVA